jgi:hypothetical protein
MQLTYPGTRISTLKEVFDFVECADPSHQVLWNIESKIDPEYPNRTLGVADFVNHQHALFATSPYHKSITVRDSRSLIPAYLTILLVSELWLENSRCHEKIRCKYYHLSPYWRVSQFYWYLSSKHWLLDVVQLLLCQIIAHPPGWPASVLMNFLACRQMRRSHKQRVESGQIFCLLLQNLLYLHRPTQQWRGTSNSPQKIWLTKHTVLGWWWNPGP